MVEIFISVNFIRLKMSSMKLIAIIAESINIDVTEMKKGRLFFIRTPQFFSQLISIPFFTIRILSSFYRLYFSYLIFVGESSYNMQLIQLVI